LQKKIGPPPQGGEKSQVSRHQDFDRRRGGETFKEGITLAVGKTEKKRTRMPEKKKKKGNLHPQKTKKKQSQGGTGHRKKEEQALSLKKAKKGSHHENSATPRVVPPWGKTN